MHVAQETPDRAYLVRGSESGLGLRVVRHAQLLRLTDSLRELSGRPDLPILIDQEGGRVARMRPPE